VKHPSTVAVVSLAATLLLGSCASGPDDEVCRMTDEYGNWGCARIVVYLTTEDGGPVVTLLPRRVSYLTVHLAGINQRGGIWARAEVHRLNGEPVQLEVTRTIAQPEATPDTATVQISASWLAQPDVIVLGEKALPVASGAITKRITFARVGQPPVYHTVRLVLYPSDSTRP